MIHEEGHTHFLYEECNQGVENSFSNVFKEDSSIPIYDERENGYLDNAPKEPKICNNRLDHQEEEDFKWDIYLCFLNSKNIFLDSIEEHNDISFETLGRNQVLISEILDEEVDVSFANCHEHIFQDCFEDQFVIKNSQPVLTLLVPLQCKTKIQNKKTQQHILPLNS